METGSKLREIRDVTKSMGLCLKILNKEESSKLLLGTDRYGNTAWHMAANYKRSETLQNVWECTEELLTKEELCKFLLGTERYGNTVWNLAANCERSETLQKVWECAERY